MSGTAERAQEITFTPTLADTLAAYRLHAARPWRIMLYALLYGALIAGIGVSFHNSRLELAVAFGGGFVLAWVFWGVWLLVVLPFRVRRIYRQQASLRGDHAVAWSETGLSVRSQRATGAMTWDDYVGRRENAALLLLYHSDAMFQFVPKRVLDGEQMASLRPYLDRVPLKR